MRVPVAVPEGGLLHPSACSLGPALAWWALSPASQGALSFPAWAENALFSWGCEYGAGPNLF